MPQKKYHIRCDLEGVTGVVSHDQVNPILPGYVETRTWFMAELLALLEGLKKGGAGATSIYDEHWHGRNVDLSALPPDVTVAVGKPPYRVDWAGGLERSHAGLILHGLHSMAGTGATLCHTYELEFLSIQLNGRLVGEIGVEAAIAGDLDVPLVLVIADSAGVEEAQQLVPGVAFVSTKRSQCPFGAECHALEANLAAIRDAVASLSSAKSLPPPFRIQGPVEMLCQFREGVYRDGLRRRCPEAFVSADTLCLTGPSVISIWADYWQLKLAVQNDISH